MKFALDMQWNIIYYLTARILSIYYLSARAIEKQLIIQ